jgi:Ca2+-binding RTX toxin-like protein
VRRLCLLIAVTVAALTAAPGRAGAEVPDAQCTASPLADAPDVRVGQTFTALNTGQLVRFQVAVNNDQPPTTWTVQINTVDGTGKPTNTTLAQTTIPVGTAPPAGQSLAGGSFPNPASVTAGTTYALVMIPAGSGNHPQTNPSNPCPGQYFGDSSTSGSWVFSYPGDDVVFATFVEPPAAPGGSTATATCKGRRATVAGTNAADKLRGTAGADVIAALGGNDKVSGLAGNDTICGGSGKDTLNGGKGNDKLFGQKDNDTLKGGPGKDKLKGGAGKDQQIQ